MAKNTEYIDIEWLGQELEADFIKKDPFEEGLETGIFDVARKMIEKDMDIALISELTGYSLEKTKQMKEILSQY